MAERPEVTVLGGVGARLDGHPVDLGPPRRRAVLARLAVAAGAVVPTDRLVDDLWHGEPPPRALAGLQAHVSHLRRALEPRRAPREPATVLLSAAPGYALRVADGLDAVRAADLVQLARDRSPVDAVDTLRGALALWTGPVLAEFADEAWARPEVERLTELHRVVVEDLAAAELARPDGAGVAPALELLGPHVRRHPLREGAVRLLALALYRAGRQAEALAGLADARRALADDLGLDPSPALRDLERRILDHDPGLLVRSGEASAGSGPTAGRDVAQAAMAGPPPGSGPRRPDPVTTDAGGGSPAAPTDVADPPGDPVIGRDAELTRLSAAATRVARGGGELVLLGGEAGAGKSTLVAELTRRLTAQGWTALRGRCPEVDGAPPAWAWTEIVDALAAAGDRTAGSSPSAADTRPTSDDEVVAQGFRGGRALADALGRVGGPVLVTLDDLHRGDDETQRVLRTVVAAATPRVLVLATYRPDEVDDELSATFASLAPATGDRLELGGLDAAACVTLMARHGAPLGAGAGTGIGSTTAGAEVAARTGGNPLFVREVARLAATVGADAARDTVPAGVRDVLRRRVAQLPAAAVSVLRHAAVLGRTVDVGVLVDLEAATDRSGREVPDDAGVEDRVLTALEAASVTGLVVDEGPDTVRFTHDLVRAVLYEEVPRLRRGRVHAAVLGVLERRGYGAAGGRDGARPAGVGRDGAAALAHHALAAGRVVGAERVVGHVEAAAAEARAAGAPRVAAELLAPALDLALDPAAGPPIDPARRTRLRCALASAQGHAGATGPATAQRATALAEARALDPGPTPLLLRAATCLDAPVSFALAEDGVVDRALIAAVGDLLAAGPPRADRVRLHAARAFAWHPGDPARCRADADAAVALTDPADPAAPTDPAAAPDPAAADVPSSDPLLRCLALNARFWSLLTPEDWHRLDEVGLALQVEGERAGSWGHRVVGHHARFLHACARHDLDTADALAALALDEAPDGQLAATLGWSTVFGAVRALVAGRLEESEAVYREVSEVLASRGTANAGAFLLAGLLGIRDAQGRLGELVDVLAAFHARIPPLVADPYALALVAAGRLDQARAVWRPGDPVRRDWWWLLWTVMRARVALALGDDAVVATSHTDLAPWSGHLAGLASGTATLGPVDLVLADLATARGRPPAERTAHLDAAAALCDRLGSPLWRAQVDRARAS